MATVHAPRPGCCPAHEWPVPDGCRWCGAPADDHLARHCPPPIGDHQWTPPTDQQRADRAQHQEARRG